MVENATKLIVSKNIVVWRELILFLSMSSLVSNILTLRHEYIAALSIFWMSAKLQKNIFTDTYLKVIYI